MIFVPVQCPLGALNNGLSTFDRKTVLLYSEDCLWAMVVSPPSELKTSYCLNRTKSRGLPFMASVTPQFRTAGRALKIAAKGARMVIGYHYHSFVALNCHKKFIKLVWAPRLFPDSTSFHTIPIHKEGNF